MNRIRFRLGVSTLALAALPLTGCDRTPDAAAAASWLPPHASTTIVVVRHAEKADDDADDPRLSAAGERRARALADMVADADVAAVYSTQFRRTRSTAQPLAERLGVPVQVREIAAGEAEGYAATLAEEILRRHAGESVVVVGHSNTVPQIVYALSGRVTPQLSEQEYHHAYVVVVPAEGRPRLYRARYGEPDAS